MILMALALAGALQAVPAQDKPVAVVAPPVMVSPPPRRSPNSRPAPKGNPGNWVTDDDYPRDALNGNMQGLVAFALDVDAGGLVAHCTILRSSGWPVLDDSTCALLKRRGRFYPALDAASVAVPGQFKGSFEWRQPGALMPAASWARVTQFTARGWLAQDCTSREFGPASLTPSPCREIHAGPDGVYGAPSSITIVEAHHAPGEAMPAGYAAPAGKPFFTRQMTLEVDAYGYIRRCTVTRERGKPVTAKYIEGCPPQWTYAKLPDPAAADRKMVLEITVMRQDLREEATTAGGSRPRQ